MKNLKIKLFIVFIFTSINCYAQLISNDINLFSLANNDTFGKTPEKIHVDNLKHYENFINFDVQEIDDREVDRDKPKFLHFQDATKAYRDSFDHPVVSLYQYNKYDPKNEGIGFCFGRAMFVHLELVQRGLDRRSLQKAFVVGPMKTPDGARWGWHVTTIAQSKDAQGKEIWLAIDPIESKVLEVKEWYQKMRNNFSTDKKLKLYITHPTRFGTFGFYDEEMIKHRFYNNYFIDLMKWFEQESLEGRYNTALLKI